MISLWTKPYTRESNEEKGFSQHVFTRRTKKISELYNSVYFILKINKNLKILYKLYVSYFFFIKFYGSTYSIMN